MDETKLIAAIDAYEQDSIGSDAFGDEISTQRALAIDAYSGKNIEPAPEGRSQVVDWTVFETIQWILPALIKIFAGGDDVVEFDAVGPEDEDAAEQESQVLNHYVTAKNNWFLTCMTWFQDALMTKNAYCYAYIEEKLIPETERYNDQTEEQVAMLLEDDVEIVGQQQNVHDDMVPVTDEMGQQVIDPMTGQPAMQQRVTYDVEVMRVKVKKSLKLRVLPPERCKVGQDTLDFTLEDCNYFEFQDRTTISDLRKEGFDVPDDIADDRFYETDEDESRDDFLETGTTSRFLETDSPDPTMRQVMVRHIWIRHDYDEDGIAELQYVLRIGRTILKREVVSTIPVACIVPFINTHRHMGFSVADLTFDLQRIKTALLRAGLDSVNLSLNPRHAVSGKVNLDDMLVSRPGGVVRMKEDAIPGQGHIMPLPTEFVFPQAQEGLRHIDTMVESRVGVNKMFQGIDASSLNDHNRIGQLSTMAAQRVELIARIFANGVQRLFKISHELLVKSGHQEETMRIRNQWVTVDPTAWRTDRDMRIVAPFAAGNKDALLQRLQVIAGFQEKAFAGGVPIVDADDAYNMAREIAKAADVSPDKFFTDPSTIPPKEPPPDYTAMALQVEQSKVEQDQREAEIRAEMDKYKADLEAEVKRFQTTANSELQVALAQIKAGQTAELERLRAELRDNERNN